MSLSLRTPLTFGTVGDISTNAGADFPIGADRTPRGFANQKAFDTYMQEIPPSPTPAIEPAEFVARPDQDAIFHQLAQQHAKIRPLALGELAQPLEGFAQRQVRLREQILARVDGNPQIDLGTAAQKQLELRMAQLENQLKSLGVLAGTPNPVAAAPVVENSTAQSLTKPFSTFFGFITNGEKQLYGLERELSSFSAGDPKKLTPADMLRLQLKMSHVSQQLELFTSMLNKGLESSKTVLNTQI